MRQALARVLCGTAVSPDLLQLVDPDDVSALTIPYSAVNLR